MARYRPIQPIEIAEPCHEDWDAMTGDVRARHCAHCGREVHNTAALTPRQIEALVDGSGPLPCLRIARFADGAMLVAEESRALPRYGTLAGAAMTALVSISAAVASAQAPSPGGLVMGRIARPQATYSGQVLDTDGKPAPHAHVYLTRFVEGKEQRVEGEADGQGGFRLQASPGEWHVGANGTNGPSSAQQQTVSLHPGEQKAAKPLKLEWMYVTAGVPVMPPKTTPPPKPKGK